MAADERRCRNGAGSIFEPAAGWFSFGSVFGLPVKMDKIFDTNWSNFTNKHENRFRNSSVFPWSAPGRMQ
jgi:hypothetical protein